MEYIDLHLDIQDDGELLNICLRCPKLDVKEPLQRSIKRPMTDNEIEIFVTRMERISRQGSKKEDEEWLKRQGTHLFTSLFSSKWKDYARKVMSVSQKDRLGMRISIFSQGKFAEETPWEILYDPLSNKFLGCSPNHVIVRVTKYYLDKIQFVANAGEKVRVLVAGASPIRMSTAHPDKEVEIVQKCLCQNTQNIFDVIPHPHVTWKEFKDYLFNKRPHVVHLVAHGNNEGIFFEDGDDGDLIKYNTIYEHLVTTKSLRLVILNVCYSENFHQKSIFDAPPEIPSAKGVWATLVTRVTISAAASYHFSVSLYQALAAGLSLNYAVGSARCSLAGQEIPESLQWSIPMLYEASDVIFLPFIETKKWATFSQLRQDNISKLKQRVGDILYYFSQMQLIINNPHPERLRTLRSTKLVRELMDSFQSLSYSPELTLWINTAIRLARMMNENLGQFFKSIDQLKFLSENEIRYRKQLDNAKKASDQMYKFGKELFNHFDAIL